MALSSEQLERYSRQMVLPGIGGIGQEKLLASKVLIVGAGGLGSAVLYYLAACGVGTVGEHAGAGGVGTVGERAGAGGVGTVAERAGAGGVDTVGERAAAGGVAPTICEPIFFSHVGLSCLF